MDTILKRILVLLLLVTSFCGIAEANPTFSNSGVAAFAIGSTKSVTVTINAGDWVLVYIGCEASTTRTVSTVTDTGGNTYTQLGALANTVSAQEEVWGSGPVAHAATTVDITMNGSCGTGGGLGAIAGTYTGLGTNGFGLTNTNSGTASTTESVALTTQDPNNVVVAGFLGHNGTNNFTFTSSVGTLRAASVSGHDGIGFNDNSSASAGSVTNTVTSSKQLTWAVIAVELRSTNSGVSCTNSISLMGAGCE